MPGSAGSNKRIASDGSESDAPNKLRRMASEEVIKGAWSPEEDDLMKNAVETHGMDWKVVATFVPGRTAKQCRDRYKLKLDPNINHGPWTPEEDTKLSNLQRELGRQWTKIAKLMPGRTENSVKSRFASLERSRNREWNDEEDRILRTCRAENLSFQDISEKYLTKRSEHAVKKRWEKLFMKDLAEKIRSELPNQQPGGQPAPEAPLPLPPPPPQLGEEPSEPVVRQDDHARLHPAMPPSLGQLPSLPPSLPLPGQPGFSPQLHLSAFPEPPPGHASSMSPMIPNIPEEDDSGQRARSLRLRNPPPGHFAQPPALYPVKVEHPYGFPSEPSQQDGVRRSTRVGNIKRQTTSVTVLQQILGEPLKNNL